MHTFLDHVLKHINHNTASQSCVIFPSKRAANLFREKWVAQFENPQILPELISIENFIERLAEIKIITHSESVFQFYQAYSQLIPKKEQENFDTFYSWAETLIQDFNEIDRYNVEAAQLFNHLSDIKDIEHWSNATEKTTLVKNYLKFWNSLPDYYQAFTTHLTKQSKAYQGLAYKLALENITHYLAQTKLNFYLVGFNALNTCEIQLFQKMLDAGRAKAFWDIDEYLLHHHKSGEFIRSYNSSWSYYQNKPIQASTSKYSDSKEISIYQVSRQVGQAKTVGQLLQRLDPKELSNTALVLGDEALLNPIVNALPAQVKAANITMGMPMSNTSLATWIEHLIDLNISQPQRLYYKDVLKFVKQDFVNQLFPAEVKALEHQLTQHHILFIDLHHTFEELGASIEFKQFLQEVLTINTPVDAFIARVLTYFEKYKESDVLSPNLKFLIYRFISLFSDLEHLLTTYKFDINFKTFKSLYQTALSTEAIDFKGSAKHGFQILGMLETRVLDFKNLIMTGVNEGVLPSGKSQNSYIPYDLKLHYGLPTYTEKDSVYAYHFFRLLQRSQTVHLLYNTDTEGMQKAEKSRFITQLEVFKRPRHHIKHYAVAAEVSIEKNQLQEIHKTPEMIAQIKRLFMSGISPSALTTYIRNPLDFYKRYVLGIRDQDQIEDEVNYRIQGIIIHDTLEKLYEPYLNEEISAGIIQQMKTQVEPLLRQEFANSFDASAIKFGQNKLVYEIAKHQIKRFLDQELKGLKHQTLKLVQLEKTNQRSFEVQPGLSVTLKGKVDRIDQVNSTYRIIDYKTGNVLQSQLKVHTDWLEFTSDYKYSKAFQVLFYTLLAEEDLQFPCQAGIISFKNLNQGYLNFQQGVGKKISAQQIDQSILNDFKKELKSLLLEIINPDIPFSEKEV